jgi:hypothetical protein
MYTAYPESAEQLVFEFTTFRVSVSGTPGAAVVELPKLLRMSLRTTPLSVSTFDTTPLTVFEPSLG